MDHLARSGGCLGGVNLRHDRRSDLWGTKVWNEPWKRSSMVFMLGMFMMFMGRS